MPNPVHRRLSIAGARWIVAPLALAAAGSGCLVGQSSDVRRTGTDVPATLFAQITPGQTTAGWVRATLGEPTASTRPGQSATVTALPAAAATRPALATAADAVWRYDYTERTDSSGYVFLIFGGHNSTETTHKAVVEFDHDGIVTRKWRG